MSDFLIQPAKFHRNRLPDFVIPLLFLLAGCSHWISESPAAVRVYPPQFKFIWHFNQNKDGYIIETRWGSNLESLRFNLDHHSPTWANGDFFKSHPSLATHTHYRYKTRTAEGNELEGPVWHCDSLNIGWIYFSDILIYQIENNAPAWDPDRMVGVIGQDIMAKAIWKFDYANSWITITSSLDSLEGLAEAEKIPATFTNKGIGINATFSGGGQENLSLDLGYNGGILLTEQGFISLSGAKDLVTHDSMRLSTPSGASAQIVSQAPGSVNLGEHRFITVIASQHAIKENLVGRKFFEPYQFFIIDYLHQTLWLSVKKRP